MGLRRIEFNLQSRQLEQYQLSICVNLSDCTFDSVKKCDRILPRRFREKCNGA